MKPTHRLALAVILFLGTSLAGRAATMLTDYTFKNGSLASTGTNALATASLFDIGPGLSGAATTGTGVFGTTDIAFQTTATPSTEALSVSGSDYYDFTVTPQNGADIQVTTLFFNFAVTNNSSSFTENLALRWSVDNFATTLSTITQTFNSGSGTEVGEQFDLSTFQAEMQAVTFRMYFYDDSDSQFQTVGISNVQLSGQLVVVPEPGEWVLLLLGAVTAACVGRRCSFGRSRTG